MSAHSEKNLRSWEATRAKGKWNFILNKGVLFWGGLMFLWMGVIYPTLRHSSIAFTPRTLAINVVVWTLGGFVFGVSVWFLSERNYIKHQRSTGTNTQ